jgi:magnesium transporter
MIHTMAVRNDGQLIYDLKPEQLKSEKIKWYWVDFVNPTDDEKTLLDCCFHFHHLTIEDCLNYLQRPKVDYYGNYCFFIFNTLNEDNSAPEEVDMYVGENYVVTFHLKHSPEITEAWEEVISEKDIWNEGHIYVSYVIMDKIVDNYFPAVYSIEDELNELDSLARTNMTRNLIEQLFNIRSKLLKLRSTVNSMRDLLYRLLNSTHLQIFNTHRLYFTDIHDHLLKLSDMIESNRDMTADIRDSYLSINSNRMNTIMTVLTVVTAIFIPLTFIVGIYGMNFSYMPELNWRYGYFVVMGVMAVIGIGMYYWFTRKGWFNFYK